MRRRSVHRQPRLNLTVPARARAWMGQLAPSWAQPVRSSPLRLCFRLIFILVKLQNNRCFTLGPKKRKNANLVKLKIMRVA